MLALPAPVFADDQDVIDYRQHVMKTLGEQMAAIGMILEKRAPADNLAAHLQVIAATAPQASKAFEPEVQGGHSKPEVWSDPADFARRLDELVKATADLATAATASDPAAIGQKMQASFDCKGCHEHYREPLE